MSFLSAIFARGEQKRGDDLDAKLRALNERDYGKGGQVYDAVQARYNQEAADRNLDTVRTHEETGATGDVGQQIDSEFGAGLSEGAANIRHSVDNISWGILKTGLKTIPITVWVIAAGVAFFYLGGSRFLKGIVK